MDCRFQRTPLAEAVGTAVCRQLVIGHLARLKVLNQSEVRARERLDSEKFYLQFVSSRAAVAASAAAADVLGPLVSPSADRFSSLVAIHGAPPATHAVAAAAVAATDASSSVAGSLGANMLNLTFRSMDGHSMTAAPHVKKVPASMTVAQVKAFLSRIFKLSVPLIKLNYRDPNSDFPEQLSEDTRSLDSYGVRSGGEILMERDLDMSRREGGAA